MTIKITFGPWLKDSDPDNMDVANIQPPSPPSEPGSEWAGYWSPISTGLHGGEQGERYLQMWVSWQWKEVRGGGLI